MKPFLTFLFFICINILFAQDSCLPQGLTITRQSQLDSFKIIYPNCNRIIGKLVISGSDVSDLTPLSSIKYMNDISIIYTNIKSISGLKNIKQFANIHIGSNKDLKTIEFSDSVEYCRTINILNNKNLLGVSGLNLIDTLHGDFKISENEKLETINVFKKLVYLHGGLTMTYNKFLNKVDGFENIKYIEFLSIIANIALDRMINLNKLQEIKSYLQISLQYFNSLDVFKSLKKVGTTFLIDRCNNLESLAGFDSLRYVGKDIQISSNASLTEINSFNNLGIANEVISINANLKLNKINGFKNLVFAKNIIFNGNYSLQKIDGFDNLQAVEQGIDIMHNRKINDLSGFDKLRFVRKLSVENEYSLKDISLFFNNIDTGFIQFVRVKRCDSLSICNSPFLCKYLSEVTKNYEISNNNLGCNNRDEILATCKVVSLDDKIDTKSKISFYPNPSYGNVRIVGLQTPVTLIISNMKGQIINTLSNVLNEINISDLPAGMYILDITNQEISERHKIVKIE